MTIGEIIINYRNAHKLSQREFAKQCGLSNGTISNIESGVNPRTHEILAPNLTTINQLAKGMNMSINNLIEVADDVPISLYAEFENNSFDPPLTANETHLLDYYRNFNEEGQEKLLDTAYDMSQLDRYKKRDESDVAEEA